MADNLNPYDDLVQQDTVGTLRVSMLNAVDKQPDVEAKLQGLAKQYGMPVDAVRLRQPEIERRARLDAVDYDTLARETPHTANHLSDPQNAALAHDDVDNMGLLETLANSFKRGVPALKSFVPSLRMVDQSAGLQQLDYVDRELAAGRTPDAAQLGVVASQYLAMPVDQRAALRAHVAPRMRTAVADSITEYLDLQRQRSAIPLPSVVDKTMGAKNWADAFSAIGEHPLQFVAGIGPESLVQSAPGLLVAIPAGIAAGPAGAGTAMGANSFLTDYAASITDMMQSAGVDTSNPEAIKAALADPKILAQVTSNAAKHAGVVGLVDAISGGIAGKMVLPTGKLAGRPLAQEMANIALQAPIQGALGAAGEAGGELAAGQDLQPGQILAEAFGEFFGTPGEVISASAKRVMHIRQEAQQADAHAKVLTELATLAEASKVRERDPEAFATFAQSLTEDEVPHLFVDANALMQAGVDINEVAMALPSVAEQIEQASATGGDLVIPIAEFLTAGPGNEFMQALIDHARTSVDAMSPAQGRQYMQEHGEQLQADIAQALGEKQGDETWQASRDAVRDEFKAQLDNAKRFTSDVNAQYANLLANFYSVTAARLGITPQELVQRYGLQVSAKEATGGRALDQGQPLTKITGEEFGAADLPVKDLRTAAKAWYDANLRGTTVVNQGSGRAIQFNNGKKAFSSSASPDKVRLFAALPALMKSGTIVRSEAPVDQSLELGVKAYHWLEGDVEVGGRVVRVGVTLREDDKGNLYYNHNPIKEGSQPSEGRTTPTHKAGGLPSEGETLDQTVPQGDNSVNLTVLNQQTRGSITLPENLTAAPAVISLFKDADLSTFIHESGHFFLEVQADLAARIQAQIDAGAEISAGERAIVDDMNTILAWFGLKGAEGTSALDEWHALPLEAKRPLHEQWARGFEAYAFEGNSPSTELRGMFQKFRAWMLAVYKELKALNVSLTDEVRGVMDRMLASTQAIQEAEAARRMGPLFKTAEQAGMSLDDFKRYHDLATGATQVAIDDLQARGLRDMKWLASAKSRKLKEMQKQADTLRRGVEREVRAEVLSQPIYRAWQFLTTKDSAARPDEISEAEQAYRLEAKDWEQKRAEAEAQATAAERTSLWEQSDEAKAEYPSPQKRGMAKGQFINRNKRRIEANVTQAMLDWDEAHPAPERPTPDVPQQINPLDIGAGKLDTAVLKAMYGTKPDAAWRKLSALRMTSEARGVHPDMVAEAFGFSSGDELVKALTAAEPPAQVIEGLTDQRMLERHGDLGTPEGVQRAVDQAIHSEVRARFVASEIKALEAGNKVKGKGPSGRSTVDLLAQAARLQAERIVSALRVRDLRPGQYVAAEARAARAAEIAMRAGKTAEALAEKRHQIINLQAAKAAYAAQDEVQRTAEYLGKFDKHRPSIDAEYLDQIHALLDRFDFAKGVSLKALDKRKTLAEWVEAQRAQGMEPEIPAELLNEANRKSYKDMTVEELRGLRDTVKQIEHLGRLKNRLLTSKAARDFMAVRDEIVDSITLHAGDRTADTRTPTTTLGKTLKVVRDFGAAHIKAATWARVFDGGQDGGPVWEYVIRTANDRADMETTMRAQATEQLHTILKPVLDSGKLGGKGTYFPSIKRSMNREGVIAMALNMGNEGNMQRMLGGENWTAAQVAPVLQTLTAAEWQAVQAVWDHFESYRPQIGAKERRVYGKEPEWVQPVPFSMQTADGQTVNLRGGYYPVKYDPLASSRAEQHNDAEAAKRQLQGAYTSATTRRGFTKSRVEEVKGRPLLYSLAGVYSGVNDVIHDLAWHEWLIDANKILRSDKIDRAIREHYGPEAVRQFKTWVADVAAGEQGLQAELDGALGRIRHGVSVAGLGFNVMSAAMQPLGITQSIVRVGAKWVGKGLAQYIAAPVAKTREVNGKSDFMANRSRTRFRELNELRNQVEGEHPVRSAVSTGAYFLMMRCQQMVDTPTWLGAYEKAISEGNPEERAIALADQAVTDAQGGGQTKDLSAIERGGPAQKLFTVFYSFMNTALNVGVAQTMTSKSRGKLAADYLMLYTVPAVLGAALKDALTPGDSGDWDSWDKAIKKMAGEQLTFLTGLMVVAREFGEAGKNVLGLSDRPRDYSGPAGTRLISDTYTFGKQVQQGELDDSFRKASINLLGDLFALPSAQINRTITGAEALADDKTNNPAALVFGFQR